MEQTILQPIRVRPVCLRDRLHYRLIRNSCIRAFVHALYSVAMLS